MGLIRKFTVVAGAGLVLASAGLGYGMTTMTDSIENANTCMHAINKKEPCTAQQADGVLTTLGGSTLVGTSFFAGTTLLSLGAFAGRRQKNGNKPTAYHSTLN